MTTPNIPTQGIEGVDVTGIYNGYNQAVAQSSTNSPDYPGVPFALGEQIVTTGGARWMFCNTTSTIANGNVVAINSAFLATPVGGAGAVGATPEATGVQIGFYQNSTSLTTGQYAWFMIQGVPTILVASAGITAPLYTSDTAGTLTGTTNTTSHFQISGITCVVTASGSTASLTQTVANSVSVRKPVG